MHARIAARRVNRRGPAGRQLRVGVEKEEPLAARGRRAGVHLTRAPARRVDPDDVCDARRRSDVSESSSAVADDDEFGAGKVGGRERARQRVRVAIDGNDDS